MGCLLREPQRCGVPAASTDRSLHVRGGGAVVDSPILVASFPRTKSVHADPCGLSRTYRGARAFWRARLVSASRPPDCNVKPSHLVGQCGELGSQSPDLGRCVQARLRAHPPGPVIPSLLGRDAKTRLILPIRWPRPSPNPPRHSCSRSDSSVSQRAGGSRDARAGLWRHIRVGTG